MAIWNIGNLLNQECVFELHFLKNCRYEIFCINYCTLQPDRGGSALLSWLPIAYKTKQSWRRTVQCGHYGGRWRHRPSLSSWRYRPVFSSCFQVLRWSSSALRTGICRLHYVSYPASDEKADSSREKLGCSSSPVLDLRLFFFVLCCSKFFVLLWRRGAMKVWSGASSYSCFSRDAL